MAPNTRGKRTAVIPRATNFPASPGGKRTAPASAVIPRVTNFSASPGGTGCLVCGLDNDHERILLCETCNGEYHIYCLKPKLKTVPVSSWYCHKCRPSHPADFRKEVQELPASIRARFGEICWTQGGPGYGWWPCCIYSPLWAQGKASTEARRLMHSQFLVFYYHCDDATPFMVLRDKQIKSWNDGLAESLYMGQVAKSHSAKRYQAFQRAFQTAILEFNRPLKSRVQQLNHQYCPEAVKTKSPSRGKRYVPASQSQSDATATTTRKVPAPERKSRKRSRRKIEFDDDEVEGLDGQLYITLWENKAHQLGFVIVPPKATFQDARRTIQDEIDKLPREWKFAIPKLGPLNLSQEVIFGSIRAFLSKRRLMRKEEGTVDNPLKLYIESVE